MNGGEAMRVGAYFYPWYDAAHWASAPIEDEPAFGRYYSANRELIGYQLAMIKAAGIDFVIMQYVSREVWISELVRETCIAISELAPAYGLKISFLIDAIDARPDEKFVNEAGRFVAFSRLAQEIVDTHPLDRFESGPDGRPLMFAFSPAAADARELQRQHRQFFWRHPAYRVAKYWGWKPKNPREKDFGGTRFPRLEIWRRRTLRQVLEPVGIIPFWTESPALRVFGDFAAVCPGYDDRALGRDDEVTPVLSRADGALFREQLEEARAKNARYVLIYSWNEYFERTQIEPTVGEGLKYVNILRAFRGYEPIEAIELPETVCSEFAIESAAPRYSRDLIIEITLGDGGSMAVSIEVRNTGPNDWVASDTVKLGYELYDAKGMAVYNERLGAVSSLGSGENVRLAASISSIDWPGSAERLYIDLVSENKFWFWQRQCPSERDARQTFRIMRTADGVSLKRGA